MDAHLKILNGPSAGQTVPISGKLIVGREEDCHLRPASEFVSRHHCVLLLDEFTLRIRDLGSKNGTFVNSRRVGRAEKILFDGDMVSVGELICQISLTSGATRLKRGIPEEQPAAFPPVFERTRGLDGDTVQTEGPSAASPEPPASPPLPHPSPQRESDCNS
ncbi:MAG TPA: FHA domain-containing protein [Planctomycetaceae bacterium]|nr:FHA domain-containing protein [Planctomycetaceae bacterium]